MTALHFQPAHRLAARIRTGKLGSLELLEHLLARVERFDGAINAIVWKDLEAARRRAREADAALARGELWGPLHGLPMTVKEAYDLAGAPSTWGDPALAHNVPPVDSIAVERLRRAGAVIFGKTNVPRGCADWQTFNAVYGTTRNPWNHDRVPGGSSGGSAAALAAGLTALELGSDIGSSIRNPAHYCGVFGLKPSFDVIPQHGHAPPGWIGGLDIGVMGPLGRSARDLELALDVLAGADPVTAGAWRVALPRSRARSLKDFRVAVKLSDPNSEVDTEYADLLQSLVDALARAGARVSEQAAPAIDTRRYHDVYLMLLRAAQSAGVPDADIERWRAALDTPLGRTNPRMLRSMVEGNRLLHREVLKLDNERRGFRERFAEFFDAWDLILCPAAASAAWPHDQEGERWQRKIVINGKPVPGTDQLFWAGYAGLSYLPAVVGPAAITHAGLPVGYQAIAGFGQDRKALAFARLVERELVGFRPPPGYD